MNTTASASRKVSERNLKIYTALWGFVLGILAASFIGVEPLVCILVITVALAAYYAERHAIILIALVAFALGALRYDIKDFHMPEPIGPTGIVASEPEKREMDTRFVFESDNGERAMVSTDFLSEVRYGDRVEVDADFKVPGVIVDEDGREFDYGAYLSKDDVYYTASYADVVRIDEKTLPAHGQASGYSRSMLFRLTGILIHIKTSFVSRIRNILPEPESSLLSGLIVAGKQVLPKDILEEFKRAGVVHIVVLSGYNITIIAEFFLLLLGFLGTRRAAAGSAAGIILFTLIAGAAATVVRAAIMMLALLAGKIIGRPGSAPRILLFTGVLMLLWNPKYLAFDPSFHLTFLAMLGLVYVAPLVHPAPALPLLRGGGQRVGSKLSEIFCTTLGVQLVVFPYLLYTTGNFSLVFLLSNLLILLIVPVTMLVGFAATLVAFVSATLAWPLAFVAHLFLAWILFVSRSLGGLSFASVHISHFPLWLTLVIYALMFASYRLLVKEASGLKTPKVLV